jgi:uncharacterized protein (TIGR02679 family)
VGDGYRIGVGEVHDRPRLERLFGGPDLAWLRARIRHRVERGGTVNGTTSLRGPSRSQREAVDRLLGRRPTDGATLTVDLAALDRIVRDAGVCDGLVTAVAALDGPLVDRRSRQRVAEGAWGEVHHRLTGGLPPTDWAAAFAGEVIGDGLLRRLASDPAEADLLVERVTAALAALPAGGVSIPRFSATVLADSHALDDGRPEATLVLKALQHRAGGGGPLPPGEDRRALWATAGLLRDELTSSVLVLGLTGAGTSLTDAVLRAHAGAREPTRLVLRQLVRHPPDLRSYRGTTVHVCENPAVLAAAAEALGADSRPLLCVEGQPSSAAQTLLAALRETGADLVYHGDFDWGGLRIGNLVVERFGARPWRFDTAAYRAAPAGPRLLGRPATAAWDDALAPAMAERDVAVHEEQVLDGLLHDLTHPG